LTEIKIEIQPAFADALQIILNEDHLICKGNLKLEHIRSSFKPVFQFQLTLTQNEYLDLSGNLNDIKVPVLPIYAGGLDGSTTVISFRNGLNETRFKWREVCPDGLKELFDFSQRVLKYTRERAPQI